MTTPPRPPWTLNGSALVFLRSWRSTLATVHYAASPVGSYNELAIIEWRKILRWPSVTTMLVDSPESMIGGRTNWGFPKELAPLKWSRQSRRVEFEYSGATIRAKLCGPKFPLRLIAQTTQVLDEREVGVPVHLQGRAQFAWRGRQLGLFMDEMQMTVLPPVDLE